MVSVAWRDYGFLLPTPILMLFEESRRSIASTTALFDESLACLLFNHFKKQSPLHDAACINDSSESKMPYHLLPLSTHASTTCHH